jgi:hypothetical protein
MCINAKESAIAFAVMVGISVVLFIRNKAYDRVLASLLIIVSLIQLVELLYHACYINSCTAGKFIFLVLWLQVAVFSVALWYHFQTNLTIAYMAVFTVALAIAVIFSTYKDFTVTHGKSHLIWQQGDLKTGQILGVTKWLYLIGLFSPLLIILYYNCWQGIGIWILLIVFVLTIIFTKMFFADVYFPTMWCYSSIMIAMAAYLIGAFYSCDNVA